MGDPNNRPGVYYIKCGECDLGYVGETGRSFQVRLREHRDDIRLGRERNAIFKHVSNTNHHIDWTSAKTLYHHSSKFERLVVESSLIKTLPNFNNMASTLAVDYLSKELVLRNNPKILSAIG